MLLALLLSIVMYGLCMGVAFLRRCSISCQKMFEVASVFIFLFNRHGIKGEMVLFFIESFSFSCVPIHLFPSKFWLDLCDEFLLSI